MLSRVDGEDGRVQDHAVGDVGSGCGRLGRLVALGAESDPGGGDTRGEEGNDAEPNG